MTSQKTVLVVEDERMLNEAYQTILAGAGYRITAAYDGEEALALTASFEPDIILLDLRMPRMSGIDFLKAYQPAQNHPTVKIVVFSNLDTQDEIEEAYELGAHRYMLKAWASPKELTQLVSDTLKQKSGGTANVR